MGTRPTLIGIDIEALRQLDKCLFALDGNDRHFCLEVGGVTAARSFRHGVPPS